MLISQDDSCVSDKPKVPDYIQGAKLMELYKTISQEFDKGFYLQRDRFLMDNRLTAKEIVKSALRSVKIKQNGDIKNF